MPRKNRVLTLTFESVQICIAAFLASYGLNAFLLPNGFLDGGATGVAILLSQQTNWNISLLLLLCSAPFFILAYFTVSRFILIKSVAGIALLSLFIAIGDYDTITDDKLLISIFGGGFLGAGIGLAIKNGSVLDGSEILGVYIYDRFGISIGKSILFFNIMLFGISAWVLSVEVALYSGLTYLVTAKIIDFFIAGFEDFIGLQIVSKESKTIQQKILNELGAGMTILNGDRGFGSKGIRNQIEIIQVVINRIDAKKMDRLIDDCDPEAFVIEFDINNIRGGVLRKYLSRDKGRSVVPTLTVD